MCIFDVPNKAGIRHGKDLSVSVALIQKQTYFKIKKKLCSKSLLPKPYHLFLHVQYWTSVLLYGLCHVTWLSTELKITSKAMQVKTFTALEIQNRAMKATELHLVFLKHPVEWHQSVSLINMLDKLGYPHLHLHTHTHGARGALESSEHY